MSRQTVVRALQAAGLAWLRRRVKTAVPCDSKRARLEYANLVLTRRQTTLNRFVYTDGTTFYLARGLSELADKKRAALGRHVWKSANGKDWLWDENVGPSLYAKAQGRPVNILGFFGSGRLVYHLLAKDGERTTHMNGDRHEKLVTFHFAKWRKECFGDDDPVHLVQDHERCLWQDRHLRALRLSGCCVVSNYPKHSADLNAIEGWWLVLRERLDATAPEEMESRDEFVARLRRTVNWLNEHRQEDGSALDQPENARARDA